MTRLEQVLAVADTATIRFGAHDVYVSNPPMGHPHAGWTITIAEINAPQRADGSRLSQRNIAPTWPVVVAKLGFIGVSLDANWQVGWPDSEQAMEGAPTRPLPAIR
jgi:hypothetical protein